MNRSDSIIVLLGNLDPTKLCKGTRLFVSRLMANLIEATTLGLPLINLRTASTIAPNLVSKYSKLTMRYTARSVIAPPGGEQRRYHSYLENGTRYWKKS
ncbi:hypothetical protein AVEN_32938-1 [Araneus ventricosus]|uniref:Uncharacterized protein n=1 Tax=Araneus ventricosus TaxID=182803 RepID=A0A4Y2T3R7_ARAVE|nr:hypothetical protein AVEN_32938-1 [Araneus ventricosus]